MTAENEQQQQQAQQQHERHLSDPYASSLVCGVCLEDYRDPRALPCLHTFCHDCLLGIHRRSRGLGLTCPCCREVSHVRPAELRKNFHVSHLQEMRPLLAMGIGLAEDFAGKARTQLAGLPAEAELAETAGQCRERLAGLRASQRSLEAFFDVFEATVRSERESARCLYSAAKAEFKERRQWAKDCLARRSVSERIIECTQSSRHQSLLDLIEEFRQRSCEQPPPKQPTAAAAAAGADVGGSRRLPTQAQVQRRLSAYLKSDRQRQQQQQQQKQQKQQNPGGKIKQRQIKLRQPQKKVRQQQQQQQRRTIKRQLSRRHELSSSSGSTPTTPAAALFGEDMSDDEPPDESTSIFVHHQGLASFVYYAD